MGTTFLNMIHSHLETFPPTSGTAQAITLKIWYAIVPLELIECDISFLSSHSYTYLNGFLLVILS